MNREHRSSIGHCAELISVGTELLLGQIVNTNATWLAQRCAALGLNVYHQVVVGDHLERIVATLTTASQRADIVVCCGGLGPTMDDLTREALATYTGRAILPDQLSQQALQERLTQQGRVVSQSFWRQIHTIEGAKVLPNEVGLAIGVALEHDGVRYVLLPGPPNELHTMFDRYVAPWLQEQFPSNPLHHFVFKCAGIGEGAVAQRLEELIVSQSDPTIATYAGIGDVMIRVTTRATHREEALSRCASIQQMIRDRLADHVYAEEEVSLSAVIVRLLEERRATIAFAESCTGGLCAQQLSLIPGCSAVLQGAIVTYTDASKVAVLGLPPSLLDAQGAVSESVARAMATHVMEKMSADYGVATTGLLGPFDDRAMLGAYVAVAVRKTASVCVRFVPLVRAERETNQRKMVMEALYDVWRLIQLDSRDGNTI